MKQASKAGKDYSTSISVRLARFLLAYRNTPTATTGVSPAELFLGRALGTRLQLLRPSILCRVLSKQADQKCLHDCHSKVRAFKEGQRVLARNLREGPKWLPGMV
jgi:hypothetical protein